MSIFKKTDFIQFGENLYEIIPPIPSDEERGGIKASSKTDAETIEAKLGDDGKLYVGADAKGSAAAALSLAEQNTQTKIDELSEAVDGKLAGKADTNHTHSEYCTESEVDAKLDTINEAIDGKANTSTLTSHTNNSEIHVTQAMKDKWNAAEPNPKVFNWVYVDSDASKTLGAYVDEAGLGIIGEEGIETSMMVGLDGGIDIRIKNKGVITITKGMNDGTISVNGKDVAVQGLGTAAYENMADIQSAIDAKADSSELAGKADVNHKHDASEIAASSPFENTQNSALDIILEDFDAAISSKEDKGHIHNTDTIKYAGSSGNIIGNGDTLTKILQGYDQRMTGAESDILNHTHTASNIDFSTKNFSDNNVNKVQSAIEYLDERIDTMNDELSQSIEEVANNKANATHEHAIADVTNLQTKLDTTLESSKDYTDEKVALLLNNSSAAVDSIMELASAMEENEEVVGALEQAIGNKADKIHNHDDRYYTETEIDTKLGTKADASTLSNKADKVHSHDDKYYTETEIDAMKETMVFIDENDNEDIADPGSSATITVDSALSSTSINPVQNKIVKAALDNKCDKSYIANIFTQLKTALENSNIEGAIAVLDSAILDMTTLA